MADVHRHAGGESEPHTGNMAHLDALVESVNKRIDTDVATLTENFKEIINLSRVRDALTQIGGKDHFDVSRETFQLETRADSMSQMTDARNHEAEQLLSETETYKRECSQLLAENWLPGASIRTDDAWGRDAP